jgi:hypothetical protein
MTTSKPPRWPIPAWKKTTLVNRAINCATLLHLYEFITDGEREKIHRRMEKWIRKNRVSL